MDDATLDPLYAALILVITVLPFFTLLLLRLGKRVPWRLWVDEAKYHHRKRRRRVKARDNPVIREFLRFVGAFSLIQDIVASSFAIGFALYYGISVVTGSISLWDAIFDFLRRFFVP